MCRGSLWKHGKEASGDFGEHISYGVQDFLIRKRLSQGALELPRR